MERILTANLRQWSVADVRRDGKGLLEVPADFYVPLLCRLIQAYSGLLLGRVLG